jgi:hypothetical protein
MAGNEATILHLAGSMVFASGKYRGRQMDSLDREELAGVAARGAGGADMKQVSQLYARSMLAAIALATAVGGQPPDPEAEPLVDKPAAIPHKAPEAPQPDPGACHIVLLKRKGKKARNMQWSDLYFLPKFAFMLPISIMQGLVACVTVAVIYPSAAAWPAATLGFILNLSFEPIKVAWNTHLGRACCNSSYWLS